MEKLLHLICFTVLTVSLLVCPVLCRSAPLLFHPQSIVDVRKDVGVVEFDWRTKGVISPVRDQGMIGDVMAYVLTEGVESLHAIDTQSPVVLLSVQEVGDCCIQTGPGSMYQGFDCITRIGGLCTQEAYHNGTGCANNTCTAVGKVGSTGWIPAGREDIMMEIILQTPIIVAVDASQLSFEQYTSGVYSDPNCSSKMLDHALQVVGYGSEAGQDYWILKNSWGVHWGEKGYLRMARGKNMCGIATQPMYPKSYEQNSDLRTVY